MDLETNFLESVQLLLINVIGLICSFYECKNFKNYAIFSDDQLCMIKTKLLVEKCF